MKKGVKKRNKELLEKAEQAQLERKQTAREVLRRMVAPPDIEAKPDFRLLPKRPPQDLRWAKLLDLRSRFK